MLKHTVSILCQRWPETLLIVAVGAGLSVVIETAVIPPVGDPAIVGYRPGWAMFVLGFGVATIGILWQMGCLGFLRSIRSEPFIAREPASLISEGRRFFWRFLGGQLIAGALWWLFSALGLWVAGKMLGLRAVSQTPLWLVHLISAAAMGLASKWLFALPAVIVAFDVSLRQALAEVFVHPLAAFSITLRQLFGALLLIAVFSNLGSLMPAETTFGIICRFATALAHQLIVLILIAQSVVFLTQQASNPPTHSDASCEDQ